MTSKITISKFNYIVVNTIVVLVVITGVLQNTYELLELFKYSSFNLTTYEGPLFVKVFKDFFIVFIIIFSLAFGWLNKNKPLTLETIICIFMIVVLTFLSAMANDTLIAAAGLRWFLPIFLFMVFRSFWGVVNIGMLTNLMYVLLSVCVALQILQLFFMPPLYGNIGPDLAARVPGFFFFPNTTAFFASVSTACVLVYSRNSFMRFSAVFLCIASSALAQSGTGIVVSLLLALFYFFGRYRKLLVYIAPLVLVPIFFFLDEITGRDNFLLLSGGGRLDVFLKIFLNEFASSSGFGLYTNTGVLVSERFSVLGDGVATVADSMFASMFGNFGVFFLIVVLSIILFLKNRTKMINWTRLMPIIGVYFLFSFTTIISEAYPMNLLLTFLIWSSPAVKVYRPDAVQCERDHV